MFKKIAIVSALGLGASISAQAAVNGFYAGGQFGAADIGYTASNLGVVYATANSGLVNPYVSGSTSVTGPNTPSVDNGTLGARIFMGYQFIPYFAAELGLDGFQSTDIEHMYGTPIAVGSNINNFTKNHSNPYSNINDSALLGGIDLVGKAMLPIGERFNIYAKGGVAYMEANQFSAEFDVTEDKQNTGHILTVSSDLNKDTVYAFRPVYGAGVSYDITPKVVLDLSWTQIPSGSDIPQSNLYALGLSYHFG